MKRVTTSASAIAESVPAASDLSGPGPCIKVQCMAAKILLKALVEDRLKP